MKRIPSPGVVIDQTFDPTDFATIQPLLRELLGRPLGNGQEAAQWLVDLSAVLERVDEAGSRAYIANACHTEDDAADAAYLHFVREIEPKLEPIMFQLKQHYIAEAPPPEPGDDALGQVVMAEKWRMDVQIFRPENVALKTECTELAKDYGKICGKMTVQFDGATRTLQQMARYLEEPDAQVRREAWVLTAERRLADREPIDQLFDQLLQRRQQIAANAGFENYRQYIWQSRHRLDYTPDDCLEFGRAIEQACVPLLDRMSQRRKDELGLSVYRPWDTAVDTTGRSPLRPFDPENIAAFVEKTRRIIERINPDLAGQFQSLTDHKDLDLESRTGKRPGGFQSSLEQSRRPFIFMNAAGVQRDVDTLLHEAGHAFHYLASTGIANLFARHAPIEFCEVASMSMELLAMEHMDLFYDDPVDADRARRHQLEGVVKILPWVATIDGFQHWLYTHPGHGADQRSAAWLELAGRFGGSVVDWREFETARQFMWHRQMHLFHAPFYYIEYAIAQLGALQVWRNYRQDKDQALAQLRQAFALGGTRPLPQLFDAAGIELDFSQAMLGDLLRLVGEQLKQLEPDDAR